MRKEDPYVKAVILSFYNKLKMKGSHMTAREVERLSRIIQNTVEEKEYQHSRLKILQSSPEQYKCSLY